MASDSLAGLRPVIGKNIDAFRTISEVAEDLDLPQHVLRFWETRFPQIKPMKRGGGRRYYRPEDVALLRAIRQLLYGEGYTIKGVQRILKEQGPKALAAAVATGAPPPPAPDTFDEEPDFDSPQPAQTYARAPQTPAQHAAPPPLSAPLAERPTHSVVTPQIEAVSPAKLSDEAVRRLREAMADLAECERILAAARRI